MRYTGPRNRLARREGEDLELKTIGSKSHASLLRRMNIRPGQRANARYSKTTEYGQQLREKQKIKRIFSLTESKLSRYFTEANRSEGNTAIRLVQSLELRLDNVLFKLGFAPTRAAARQLVNHGHVTVNGEKVSIPSFHASEGDVIAFKSEKTSAIPYIEESMKRKDVIIPTWLERKGTSGKVVSLPTQEEFQSNVDLQAVIEFYSR